MHSTIDNIDIKQDTLTGAGTTHHTNRTLFLPVLSHENRDNYITPLPELASMDKSVGQELQPYYHGQRTNPPRFSIFYDNFDNNFIAYSFKKDVMWALVHGVTGDSGCGEIVDLLGSWTPFNRSVTESCANKSIIEYEPQLLGKPDYSVCKSYLDSLLNTIHDLGLQHIFSHADEDIYNKLLQILWKYPDRYFKIIPLLGGFHELLVRQKLIHKRHSIIGYKQWFVESGVMLEGSAEQAFKGKHYYRCMRLLKAAFCALVQFRIENFDNGYQSIDSHLLHQLKDLRLNPSPEKLQQAMSLPAFDELHSRITSVDGYQGKITMAFLHDISALLSLVSAVRENKFEHHLAAERQMVPLLFAYNHQNYARYLSYQQVFMSDLKHHSHPAYQDLCSHGFGASYTSGGFRSVHGDLVTEWENREMKGTAGPYKSGFSTNVEVSQKYFATAHLHAKLQTKFREKLSIKTSSIHKENTFSGKKNFKVMLIN